MLAWLWLLCLAGTLLVALPSLETTNQTVVSGLHVGLWLLVFPATRHFGWGRGLPVLLWGGLGVGVGLSVSLLLLGPLGTPGWMFAHYAHQFFLGTDTSPGTWKTKYVYFRRGQSLLVSQRRTVWTLTEASQESRHVRLTPVTPLLRWVTPVELEIRGHAAAVPPGYEQWTPVQKPAREFSLDDDEQQLLDALKAAERRCQTERVRLDRLLRRGELRLALPPATRIGAGTAGCQFGGEVWRDFLPVFEAGLCRQRGAMASLDVDLDRRPGRRFTLQVSAYMRVGEKLRNIYLNLPGLRGPGMYVLGPDTTSSHTAFGPYMSLWQHKTRPAADDTGYVSTELQRVRVTITRFDTVARVVSGTFEGHLYNRRHGRSEALPLRAGRFDVRYQPGPWLRRH
ncbi:hypothetical protein GCM10027048_25780 [Hymenobacter coalescens]